LDAVLLNAFVDLFELQAIFRHELEHLHQLDLKSIGLEEVPTIQLDAEERHVRVYAAILTRHGTGLHPKDPVRTTQRWSEQFVA